MARLSRQATVRTIGRVLTLVVISLLAAFIRLLGPEPGVASGTLLLGFLLLAAFVAGELARELRLPRITGYLVIGILFGPYVIGLLPKQTVRDFRLINGVALSLIALQAGGELRMQRLRERLLSIGAMTLYQTIIITAGIVAAVFLFRGFFPFLAGESTRAILAVALILGLVAGALSPATTIAVVTEVRSSGVLTDTVLGLSILKDVAILVLIAVIVPTASVLVDPAAGFDFHQLGEISLTIILALVLGGIVGLLVGLYLAKVNLQPILFVLAVALGVVEFSFALGFKDEFYILMSLTAGFVVQNFSVHGPRFLDALEANSLPLYALFFAVAGADLDLSVIPAIWQAAVIVLVARTVLLYVSTLAGAVAAKDEAIVRSYAWLGCVAQAGVTLGLANIVRERFPEWGEPVTAAIIAMIAVNQLVGPPLFRFSLVRAGEAQ